MSYPQPDEPTFLCPVCGKQLTLNDSRVKYGLFANGRLLRCSNCFEKFKHDFWLRRVAEAE